MDLRLDIDPLRLDEEWLGAAAMFHHFACKAADADAAADAAKSHVKIVAAELELAIRDDPEAYGLKKATEASVEAAVFANMAYRAAVKRLNDANHGAALARAATAALDTRKRALEKLVDLLKQDYYAQPRESRESDGTMAEVEKRDLRSRVSRPRRTEDNDE